MVKSEGKAIMHIMYVAIVSHPEFGNNDFFCCLNHPPSGRPMVESKDTGNFRGDTAHSFFRFRHRFTDSATIA